MLLLGHVGITLGAAVLLNGVLTKGKPTSLKKGDKLTPRIPATQNYPSGRLATWFTALGNRIDVRLLLIGSLLPDIIDKPVGQVFFRETFSTGRIFSHTLLFLILISLIGLYLYRSYHQNWLLILAAGTLAHDLFDQMWLSPKTLFWPLYGFTFEKIDLTGWTGSIFHALLTDPAVYVPEIIGGIILAQFAWILLRHRMVRDFIQNRKLSDV